MADKKIIAVLGATGAQGGGLVRAILSDPNGGFAARAITRDVNSDKAKELAKLGAEVVAADVDDAESLEEGVSRRLRGVLRHVLLGALLAREGASPGHRHGPRRQARRQSSTSSGPAWKTRASGCLSATIACPPSWANTRCRTSTPRAKPTRYSPGSACP